MQSPLRYLLPCGLLFFLSPLSVHADDLPALVLDSECVVLLHGLVRSARSMEKLEEQLQADGYRVVNVDYASRSDEIEDLTDQYLPDAIDACGDVQRINFVTHSMGGIMLRYWFSGNAQVRPGRTVMLAPPNQGSELVDKLQGLPGYKWLNGPAGYQLGTGDDSLPLQLGPANFEVGVIAGSASFNPLYSSLVPGDDDGKVSVERARLAGMSDFIVLEHSHSWMMRADPVIYQVRHFLSTGSFDHVVEGER